MALDGNGHGTHAAGRVTIKEFTITRKTDTSASADAAAGPNYFIGRLLSADDLARDTAAATGGDTATRRMARRSAHA